MKTLRESVSGRQGIRYNDGYECETRPLTENCADFDTGNYLYAKSASCFNGLRYARHGVMISQSKNFHLL